MNFHKTGKLVVLSLLPLFFACAAGSAPIDRHSLVTRNNPHVNSIDELQSLSVGNGRFAFTVDATGLQTFPEYYAAGVCLGTQSEWGWHSFPNDDHFEHDEILKAVDFGKGRTELYAAQFGEPERLKRASDWFRANPHRLHLGTVGLEFVSTDECRIDTEFIKMIDQNLDLWQGRIESSFKVANQEVSVSTVCDPFADRIAACVRSNFDEGYVEGINLRLPYPTGKHSDDGCDWESASRHSSKIEESGNNYALISHQLDTTNYYILLSWTTPASLTERGAHHFVLTPDGCDSLCFVCEFIPAKPAVDKLPSFEAVSKSSSEYWSDFWQRGGAVDFSECTDPRAAELERRVVLSEYLTAIQCAGAVPPQESGLTYNTWFGRPHLEMHWWHGVHFALWGRADLLERSLGWYGDVAYPVAKSIAERQGYDGVRWQKMTDKWGNEAPSNVGSYLIWQQPHIIYMAELIYRHNPTRQTLDTYKKVVLSSAEFIGSFVTLDTLNNRYIIKGAIPAQETLDAATTVNPPLELSYWYYALSTAQKWRERLGMERSESWDDIIGRLSPLSVGDGLYLAAENAVDTYRDIRYTSDHMAVLGALGMLPSSPLVDNDIMTATLEWVIDNWNWDKTWGWDYPLTAMCAARLGHCDDAVNALLMDKRTNTYLVSGHNYQDSRLRIYLPGNGGLLTAVAMMCAGWDGCRQKNPGFPKDGRWNVKWEGLEPMP